MMTYAELQIIRRELERLKKRGELLDSNNSFERRELQSIVCRLRMISSWLGRSEPTKRHLEIVRDRKC